MNRSESPMVSTMRVYSAACGRIGHEAQLPVFRVMQVGEAAFDQGANEVNRQAGPLVSAEQQVGVGRPIFAGEPGAVDHVAAVAGQA